MKRLKLLLLTAMAITVITAITAAAANAEESLPSILWLTSEEKVKSLGEQGTPGGGGTTVVARFNGPLSITATYLLVQLFAESKIDMVDEGTATILFEGSKVSTGGLCFTEGDSETKGAVLIDNATWQLRLDLSHNFFVLLQIPEFTLKCPGSFPSSIKIRGSVLNKVTPFGGGEHSALTSESQCTAKESTTAKWKEYDTHEGTMASDKLEANGGLGFSEVCEEVFNPVTNNLSTPVEPMEP